MRRDVCFYLQTDVKNAYAACLTAAKNPPFERACKEEPYHTFSFGVNYSFKYNMNGGSCTVRFIPVKGGSAVNLRFTLAQGVGGRCEKYAEDLMKQVQACTGLIPQSCKIDVEEFVKEENKVYLSCNSMAQPAGQYASEPVPATWAIDKPTSTPAVNNGNNRVCPKCGNGVSESAAFCSACGSSLKAQLGFCSGCGTKVAETAVFCHQCGKKL